MDIAQFKASLVKASDTPPSGLAPLARALWLAARGKGAVNDDWHAAHAIAQDDPSPEGSWVHAHLHRIEGDLGNAGYWYRRAEKPVCAAPLEAEWAESLGVLWRSSGLTKD